MYKLPELFEGMRGVCVRHLQAAFDDLTSKQQRFVAEPAMKDKDGLARHGELQLPFRCDALVMSADGNTLTPQIFTIEKRWNFSPAEFDYAGLIVALSPCHWENIKVTVTGDPKIVAAGVKAWFETAFVPSVKRGGHEIQHAVHDISNYSAQGNTTVFTLDCGSMPVDHMFALFDLMIDARATRVELSMP
jgi:hypothetical protein